MSSNIPQQYKDAAQQLPADMLKEDFSVNGLTEKEVRAIHTKTLFQENSILLGLESGSVAGVNKRGAAAQDEKRKFEKQREKKQRETTDTIAYLLNQTNALDEAMRDQYGEYFADDLIEELHAKGHLSKEEYESLKSIQDQSDKEHALAVLVQEKIDAGTMPADALDRGELGLQWSKSHSDLHNERDHQAHGVEKGDLSTDKAMTSANDKAKVDMAFSSSPDNIKPIFTEASIGREQADHDLQNTVDVLANLDALPDLSPTG